MGIRSFREELILCDRLVSCDRLILCSCSYFSYHPIVVYNEICRLLLRLTGYQFRLVPIMSKGRGKRVESVRRSFELSAKDE